MKLRVLSWNIHKGIGGLDRKYSLERIADLLNEQDADIALLQEVADGWPQAGGHRQAERLTSLTDLRHHAFAPEHRFKTGGYGNAILSRYPLIDQHRIDLKIGWRKQRSALQATVLLNDADESADLAVTSLHLGLAETERRAQLKSLFEAEHVATESTPMILGGDFNDVFGGLERRFLQAERFERAVERAPSFPAIFPFFSLDGIFTRDVNNLEGRIVSDRMARQASDHRPLVATIQVPNKKSAD